MPSTYRGLLDDAAGPETGEAQVDSGQPADPFLVHLGLKTLWGVVPGSFPPPGAHHAALWGPALLPVPLTLGQLSRDSMWVTSIAFSEIYLGPGSMQSAKCT